MRLSSVNLAEKELQKRISRKAQEIEEITEQISSLDRKAAELRAYQQALQDMLKVLADKDSEQIEPITLRPGTEIAKVRDLLLQRGRAMHVTEILNALGKDSEPKAKVSLTGSLSSYARARRIFTKVAPNTFWLVEEQQKEKEKEGSRSDNEAKLDVKSAT